VSTSSLLDIYEGFKSKGKNGERLMVDARAIKDTTRRSDIIMTSTLCISVNKKREECLEVQEKEASDLQVNVFPPLESDFSKSEEDESIP
jgi:hypothetical protein